MEQAFRTEYFDNVADIQDFLASNLNSDEPFNSELSSVPSDGHDLSFYFDDKIETSNANHGVSSATKRIQKAQIDKKKYQNISNELRLELIDAVVNKQEKIKHAAKRLGINYSSAKYIFQIYKKEGRKNKIIFKKKTGKDEAIDHVQNNTLYTSSTSNIFATTQPYILSKQDGDPSMFSRANWTTAPRDSSEAPVLNENSEVLEANKEIITEKEKLINHNVSKETSHEQYHLPDSQNNLQPTEQIRPIPSNNAPKDSAFYQNPSYGQSVQTKFPGTGNMTFIPGGAQVTQPTSNGAFLVPYAPFNLNTSSIPQGQMNQNMPFYTNGLQPNLQVYPINYAPYGAHQLQNFPVQQFPVYQPLQNNISFPMYTQIPPSMHNLQNQMAMPVMVYFIGNPGPPTVDNTHNTQTDNR